MGKRHQKKVISFLIFYNHVSVLIYKNNFEEHLLWMSAHQTEKLNYHSLKKPLWQPSGTTDLNSAAELTSRLLRIINTTYLKCRRSLWGNLS